MCISSIQQTNKNSIEFSLSTQTRRAIKSSQAKSLHWPSLLLYLLWHYYIYCYLLMPSPFYFNIWALPLIVPYSPTSEIFYFFHYLLPPHFYFFPHSTLYHPTCYYFKFILENWFSLHLLLFIPTVIGQVPELLIALTYPSSFFF